MSVQPTNVYAQVISRIDETVAYLNKYHDALLLDGGEAESFARKIACEKMRAFVQFVGENIPESYEWHLAQQCKMVAGVQSEATQAGLKTMDVARKALLDVKHTLEMKTGKIEQADFTSLMARVKVLEETKDSLQEKVDRLQTRIQDLEEGARDRSCRRATPACSAATTTTTAASNSSSGCSHQ